MNDNDTLVIDVRDATDFSANHIQQALSMPLGKLAEDISKITEHKTKPVLIACLNGTR